MARATGPFDVKLTPQVDPAAPEWPLARMAIMKHFHGDLDASSQGQMLSAGTEVQGSAAYVAIERVSGTLAGRPGTFILQHRGIMNRGTPHLTVTVVPDSGTGELVGLEGAMSIQINGGKHTYEFEYAFSASAQTAPSEKS